MPTTQECDDASRVQIDTIPNGIVDMHCHMAGIGASGSGCFVSPSLQRNWRFRIYLRSFGVSQREAMQQGDELIARRLSGLLAQSRFVSRAVILAMDGVVGADGQLDRSRTEFYVPDEFVARVCKRCGNLLFGASVNPYRADALDRLEQARSQGAVLLKWLPPIMEINPDDPKLVPFYEKMVELNLPLLSHTGGESSFSKAREELGDPEKLRLPLSVGVKVVAAHIAASAKYEGERGPVRLARLMREFPNLYSDISALTNLNKPGALKEALTTPEFSGRLVYGTDFPLINMALVSPWYCFGLTWRQRLAISRTQNPWDRDVMLKQALGVSAETFALSSKLFQAVN